MGFKKKIKKGPLMIYYNKLKRIYYSLVFNIPLKNILQLANTTHYNRHEDLFLFTQKYFGKSSKIKILSFGCSTGEECFSIRNYFRDAIIMGCDINKKSLSLAQKKNKDNKISFFLNKGNQIVNEKYFDLIFANSVLCKQPEDKIVDNLESLFSFKQFNSIIKDLDSVLSINSLIVIRYSNYKFEDTSYAHKYQCLSTVKTDFPLFDTRGKKLNGQNLTCEIFKKIKL
jgi:hypothetical protein